MLRYEWDHTGYWAHTSTDPSLWQLSKLYPPVKTKWFKGSRKSNNIVWIKFTDFQSVVNWIQSISFKIQCKQDISAMWSVNEKPLLFILHKTQKQEATAMLIIVLFSVRGKCVYSLQITQFNRVWYSHCQNTHMFLIYPRHRSFISFASKTNRHIRACFCYFVLKNFPFTLS